MRGCDRLSCAAYCAMLRTLPLPLTFGGPHHKRALVAVVLFAKSRRTSFSSCTHPTINHNLLLYLVHNIRWGSSRRPHAADHAVDSRRRRTGELRRASSRAEHGHSTRNNWAELLDERSANALDQSRSTLSRFAKFGSKAAAPASVFQFDTMPPTADSLGRTL